MRILLIVVLVLGGLIQVRAQSLWDDDVSLDDNLYKARVEYTNYKTGYSSEFDAVVKVRNNKVTEIRFDNGGYIHDNVSVYEPQDYLYSGGRLNSTGYGFKANVQTQSTKTGSIYEYKIKIE